MTFSQLFTPTLFSALIVLNPLGGTRAHASETPSQVSSVSVMMLQPELDHLAQTFQTRGTSAVGEEIRKSMLDEKKLAAWRELANGGGEVKVSVEIHESEAKAVEALQRRMNKMGLPNLKFEGKVTEGRPDPHQINDEEIRYHKWIRYGAGPAITLAASYFNLPAVTTGTLSDYMFILMPAATGVFATIVLEIVFANPTINNNFWKPLWNYGGPVGGRMTNIAVNFAVGLGLWAAQVGGAHLPELFGAPELPMHLVSFKQAAWEALWGAALFNVFFGQYQTDLAHAENEGSITTSQRYKLETTGGVLVGGGRVAYWTLPHDVAYLGLMAEVGFFMLKTLPQAIKNYVADPMNDRRVARLLAGDQAKKPGVAESCALALSDVGLVNLPRNEKNLGNPFHAKRAKATGPMLEAAPAAM